MENMPTTILLVDDDDATNYINQLVIARAGVKQVIATENGREALLYLHEHQYINPVDLILLDLNMPIVSGWEFLELYQQLPKKEMINIYIMLSTDIGVVKKEALNRYDAVKGFIEKPLSKSSFLQVLEREVKNDK